MPPNRLGQFYINLLILQYYKKLKNPFFSNKKPSDTLAKGLVIVWLPRQNDYRTFCMNEEAEKVYHKLEELTCI